MISWKWFVQNEEISALTHFFQRVSWVDHPSYPRTTIVLRPYWCPISEICHILLQDDFWENAYLRESSFLGGDFLCEMSNSKHFFFDGSKNVDFAVFFFFSVTYLWYQTNSCGEGTNNCSYLVVISKVGGAKRPFFTNKYQIRYKQLLILEPLKFWLFKKY